MNGPSGLPMHIGLDISQTGTHKAGCGYFAYAMTEAMLAMAKGIQFTLYPNFGDFYFDKNMPKKNPFTQGMYGPHYDTHHEVEQFWNAPDLQQKLNFPDIIHANNFWCPVQLTQTRLIYTFYDMGFVINPEWTTEANRVGCYEGVFRASVVADWIVAISKASRDHFLSVFPTFPEERVRVIYPCSRFKDSDSLGVRPPSLHGIHEGKFWLSVGTIEPRKNQRRLAESYARYLALGGEPMPLVFAGGYGWLMDDFQLHLKTLGIEQNVILTGYVSDDELIWLYRASYANIYPSLFEGFGLPVLEGMQFGAATITSNCSSIPEVSGQAAWLLDPLDTEAWAQALLKLSKDKEIRDRMKERSTHQAKSFQWESSARALLNLYEEAYQTPADR